MLGTLMQVKGEFSHSLTVLYIIVSYVKCEDPVCIITLSIGHL